MNFQKVLWKEPWLAPVAMGIRNIIKSTRIETIGITPDGTTVYFNPEYWKSLNEAQKIAVEIHILLHIINRHSARRGGRIHSIWNVACDISINYLITASGYILPPDAYKGENDSAEHIYNRLVYGSTLIHDKVNTNRDNTRKNDGCDIHSVPLSDDLLTCNIDGSEYCDNSDVLEAIESTKLLLKTMGKGSTPLSKLFKPLSVSKSDWRAVLWSFTKSIIGDEFDYLGYEFDEFGICEDLLIEKPQVSICALVDESGSISDLLYSNFLSELSKLSRVANVYVSGFTDNSDLNEVPVAQYKRSMTGGTNIIHTYEQACSKHYDCIVVLTDGELVFPKSEAIPTIWVMPKSNDRKYEVII